MKMTQEARLLQWLESGKGIDPLTAWTELGIYRVAARVNQLRDRGHNIKTDKKTVFSRFGDKAIVAWYTLAIDCGTS